MKLFMCFSGAAAAAAVIDDEAAEVAATHLQGQRLRGRRSLSFRRKFLFGYKGGNEKKPSVAPPLAESKKRGMMDADDAVYGGMSRASSVASSALLSTALSLDSDTSASSSASSSSRSSTASSSPSVSGVLYPPPVKRHVGNNNKRPASSSSPAAGAAAVVLCLLMVVFCGRVGATLLTSTALYLFPRRWRPARTMSKEEKRGAADSLECDAAAASASEAEEEAAAKRKVVVQGS